VKQLVDIWRGSLLHDIGKIGIPDSILLKPGELTKTEWGVESILELATTSCGRSSFSGVLR